MFCSKYKIVWLEQLKTQFLNKTQMLQNDMYERNKTLSISTSLLSMFFRDNYGTVPAYQLTCSNTTRINYSTLLYEKTQRDFLLQQLYRGA